MQNSVKIKMTVRKVVLLWIEVNGDAKRVRFCLVKIFRPVRLNTPYQLAIR